MISLGGSTSKQMHIAAVLWNICAQLCPVGGGQYTRAKPLCPKHQCQQSQAMLLCRQPTMHRGAYPGPEQRGHRGHHRDSCLLGSQIAAAISSSVNKLFLLREILHLNPAAGMTSFPQGRCRGSRLQGSSTSSQNTQVSE